MGDVILTTPSFQAARSLWPESRLTVLVQESPASVLKGLKQIDEVIAYLPNTEHRGWAGIAKLAKQLRAGKYDGCVHFQANRDIAFATWLAGIPVRVGPLSKGWSYGLFNCGVRQRRSQVEKHEAEYNLDLLRALDPSLEDQSWSTEVAVAKDQVFSAENWLRSQKLNAEQPRVVIHPGMGGSAQNWPMSHYLELTERLLKEKVQVIWSLGPMDAQIQQLAESHKWPNRGPVLWIAAEGQMVDSLAGLYSLVDAVVAPSTGPLHLAVALGIPTVSFYPKLRVQSSKRWGPYHPEALSAILPIDGGKGSVASAMHSVIAVMRIARDCSKAFGKGEAHEAQFRTPSV